MDTFTIIGTHIAVSWENTIPPIYGTYKGMMKNGKPCSIEVDWKIKAYDEELNQVGTDQIKFWLCDVNHIKTLIEVYEGQ